MYGQFRKEGVGDTIKIQGTNTTSTTPAVGIHCVQKSSPTSTDDVAKGENTQNTQNVTNPNRYDRRKCGLKPVKPASVSASSLNPTTPGRLLNPTTPGRQMYTPRLNFKENDIPKYGMSEFPATPKFSRSESTPELHRIKKLDHFFKSTDSNVQEKTHNYPHQDSSMSNLLTITSDSLPDIFRKPITQQQPDLSSSIQTHQQVTIEKVSKWGYGPITSSVSHCSKMLTESTKPDCLLKPVKEEILNSKTTVFKSQSLSSEQVNKFGEKSELPLRSHPETPLKLHEDSNNIFSKSLNKSTNNTICSNTATTLHLPSQPTVKAQLAIDQPPSSVLKQSSNISWTGQLWSNFRTVAEQPPVPNVLVKPVPQVDIPIPASNKILLTKPQPDSSTLGNFLLSKQEPLKLSLSTVEVQQPEISSKQLEPVKPIVNNTPLLPPPNARPPSKIKQITVNGKTFTVMKPLGRGGSSVVYQVLNSEMTDVFALKVVRLDSVDEVTAEGYINEVRLLKQLQGLPRVVRLLEYEYDEDEEKLLLVMEKGDTDFATVIRSRTTLNAINPTLVRFYWQEMLEAVGEIHNKNVIHTDLKPANFLLVNGGLKLIDFGIATSIQADMTSIMKDSQCGTYNYMAPEAIKSSSPVGMNQEYKISRKTDVWSLGCILYSLVYKNPPFNKFRDTIEKINAIVDERYAIDFPVHADPMVVAVLKSCLDRNPRNRPTIEELLSHPYLTCTDTFASKPPKPQGFNELKSQLEPYMEGGKLSDTAKNWIRQWM